METRQVHSKKQYLYAFIIGTILFAMGFIITYSVAYFEFQRTLDMQGPLSYEIFQEKLQVSLFGKDICSEEIYKDVSGDLEFQGNIMATLENKMGKNNKDVIFRKKFYSLILLEHLELVNDINKQCGKKINTILFFYSNKEEYVKTSEEMGKILSTLSAQNKNDLFIYSFDMDIDSELIKALNEKYGVSPPVKIVVNDKYSFSSIDNINAIQQLLY